MSKKTDDVSADKQDVPVFDADRPTLPNPSRLPDPAVLSHNYQENSPAIDLREVGTENVAVNLVDQLQKAAEDVKDAKEEKQEPISQAEYDRRTKLDVSNGEYINKSLDHYKVK